MKTVLAWAAGARKALAAIAGVAAEAVNAGLVHGTAARIAALVIAAATAAGVWAVPNKPPTTGTPAQPAKTA